MPAPNHNTNNADLYVYQMVLNRLRFLAESVANEELLSAFTLEVMAELELCFQVDKDIVPQPTTPDTTHIGNEEYYSIVQRAIVADVVACYVIMIFMSGTSGGVGTLDTGSTTTTSTPLANKFLKKTKAGSVEVEWDLVDAKSTTSLYTSGGGLLDFYKKSAMRKARAIGCIIDICEDCSLSVSCMLDDRPAYFIVQGGCSSSSENIPSRG